jgi:hypothetical protein
MEELRCSSYHFEGNTIINNAIVSKNVTVNVSGIINTSVSIRVELRKWVSKNLRSRIHEHCCP